MASPWGDNRYPPSQSPGRYPPNGQQNQQYDPRLQYGQPAAPGFYNPAILPPRQPQFPIPTIPHILMPGGRGILPPPTPFRGASGDLSGDLFFQSPPSFPKAEVHIPLPPPIKHTISAPAPPLPKKPDFHQPPVHLRPAQTAPPGAFPTLDLYPQTVHIPADSFPQEKISASTQGYARATPIEQPFKRENDVPAPPISGPEQSANARVQEDAELKRALEQSKRDAEARRLREDDELARAMQESLQVQPRRTPPSALPALHIPSSSHALSPPSRHSPASSSASREHDLSLSQTASPSSYFPPVSSGSPLGLRKAHSHYFPSPEAGPTPQAGPSSSTSSTGASRQSQPVQQILDDEALARSLMEEEEREMKHMREEEQAKRMREQEHAKQRQNASVSPVVRENGSHGSGAAPPQYMEVMPGSSPAVSHKPPTSSPTIPSSSSLAPPHSGRRDASPSTPEPSLFPANGSLYRSISANASPKPDTSLEARSSRSHSFAASTPHTQTSRIPSTQSSPNTSKSPPLYPLPSVQEGIDTSSSSSGGVASGSPGAAPNPNESRPPPPPVTSTQFVDPELLQGVSKYTSAIVSTDKY